MSNLAESIFDDIRPYYDSEIPQAMHRIAASDYLPQLADFVFPDKTYDEVADLLRGITTTHEFQHQVMYYFNCQVIQRSITEFSCNGLQQLDTGKPYLFVSNHRDIVLDASLLQNALVDNGFDTCEITFGANLMCNPLIIDIGCSNKMFRVERGGDARQFYQSSLHLSRYIRHVITEKHSSVWIAQRNGRTKDGVDLTEQGLIKMFAQSGGHDKMEALNQLNIVPIAVSYEWESCDVLKATEISQSLHGRYIKQPGEDIRSILTGIMQPKGRVHFEVCPPLKKEELEAFSSLPLNDAIRNVAELIDRRIIEAYRLMPTNYIAYQMLYPASDMEFPPIDQQQKQTFIDRINALEVAEARDILLHIYANPIHSKLKLSQH